MKDKAAIDTNVLVYAFYNGSSEDSLRKSEIALALLSVPAIFSIQVFNEFANIGVKKLGMPPSAIEQVLDKMRAVHNVVPLDWNTTCLALALARKDGFSFYDSLIVSSALLADCTVLYTEDMQHKRLVLGQLRIVNPFRQEL